MNISPATKSAIQAMVKQKAGRAQRQRRSPVSVRGGGRRPRILMVTPEITYLPDGMEAAAPNLRAKAGGLADVAATLVHELSDRYADVHVALPHYRNLFDVRPGTLANDAWRDYRRKSADTRVHLAEDRAFYYRDKIYAEETLRLSLAFQREVINNIIPRVQPDIIHCHDWMTGLVPAAARRLNIPCLFTVHNIHTEHFTLAQMEDRGIDSADFWRSLYFERAPGEYEETRDHNRADLLTSGILAADHVNTVSPSFLDEITKGEYDFIPHPVRAELRSKWQAGAASGILNSPDPSYAPETDKALAQRYGAADAAAGKAANKRAFQEQMGLKLDPQAPIFLWPSRLDPVQKGCQLLTHILEETVSRYAASGLQVALVADGEFQQHFYEILNAHGLHGRVAICDFDERLSRLGYAASDFTFMPSRFEPCGLAQMVAAKYGSLPIVHHTGGLRDTVTHLDADSGSGNGFVFHDFDADGLRWAISEAMAFYGSGSNQRGVEVGRVMRESQQQFNAEVTFSRYLDIYDRLAGRPLCELKRADHPNSIALAS